MDMILTNFSNVGNAIGWTLIHFLWQGTLLFLSYWVITRVFIKHKINIHYWIGMATIMLCLIIPIREFINQLATISDTNIIHQLAIEINIIESNGLLNPLDLFISLIQKIIPYLVIFWSVAVLLISTHLIKSWVLLVKLSKNSSMQLPEKLALKLESATIKLKLKFKPIIIISKKIDIPATFGYFKPVILFPVSLISKLPQDQIEAILLHELCHVKRADFLHNILQLIVETLFFYHPLTKWISRDVRKIREHCCDELVLKLDTNPLVYAKALTNIATIYNDNLNPSHLQIAATDGELFNRIKFLMLEKRAQLPFTNLVFGLFISILTIIILNNIFYDKNNTQINQLNTNKVNNPSIIENNRPDYATPNIYNFLKVKSEKKQEASAIEKINKTNITNTNRIKKDQPRDIIINQNAGSSIITEQLNINTSVQNPRAEIINTSKLDNNTKNKVNTPHLDNSIEELYYPKVIKKINPIYTNLARSRGIEGTVILSFNVNKKGKVKNIKIDKTSPMKSLDINAKAALKKWRFDPNSINENSLNNRYQQIFSFKLSNELNCNIPNKATGTRINKTPGC
jgi:TonB family protein